jgi:hypothetical protein
LTRNTVFSFRGGREAIAAAIDAEPELGEVPAAVDGTLSPSSRATECAVTRAGKPAPARIPAMIPLMYESTESPPKSAGTLTYVLRKSEKRTTQDCRRDTVHGEYIKE